MEDNTPIQFQAEITQLMDIIVNNFYSNKDVFLRELISNASDAIDKAKFTRISQDINTSTDDHHIRISTNKEDNIITIEDTGIGMSRDDLINNLGTIAKSGTKHFFDNTDKSKPQNNVDLIGQFGMGFYSAYLVADRVKVITKKRDTEAYIWESDAKNAFSLSKFNESISEGTRIELHLKEDMKEYLDNENLKNIVMKHSQFINHPIQLYTEKTREVPVSEPVVSEPVESEPVESEPVESESVVSEPVVSEPVVSEPVVSDPVVPEPVVPEPVVSEPVVSEPVVSEPVVSEPVECDDTTDQPKGKVEEVDEEENDQPKGKVEEVDDEEDETPKTETETYYEWDKINKEEPIWIKNKADVSEDEYKSFYKTISDDFEDALSHNHFSIEGQVNVKGLLFIPKRKPFDMFQNKTNKCKIKLYVKRVLITDDMSDIIPEWLHFVNGVVDCEDLPLNVSREMLQKTKTMNIIKKTIIKKCIELIQNISENEDNYKILYENFSKNIKLGVHEDTNNRNKLISLLRYPTNLSQTGINLDKYIEDIDDSRKEIYYIIGENLQSVISSPFLEKLNKNKKAVLLMTDPLDEYVMQTVKDYNGYSLASITKESLKLEEVEDNNYDLLCKKMKELLGERVEKVKLGSRIIDSPSCLVTTDFGWTANMERIMNAQTLGDNSASSYMKSKKIMEINKDHKVIKELNKKISSDENDPLIKSLTEILYDVSCMRSGFNIENSSGFSDRLIRMIELGLNLDDQSDEEDTQSTDDNDTCEKQDTQSTDDNDTCEKQDTQRDQDDKPSDEELDELDELD